MRHAVPVPVPVLAVCLLVGSSLSGCGGEAAGQASPPQPSTTSTTGRVSKPSELVFRPDGGGETSVYDANGQILAVLTAGARTVTFIGPERTFTEVGSTVVTVRTHTWVRLAPKPWTPEAAGEQWFRDFLRRYANSTDTDVLATVMQYMSGAPVLHDEAGTPYAGDAGFGLNRDEDGVDGADFNDYLGVTWTFPGGDVRRPDPKWYRKLDCSGYLRLVFGYRSGVRLLWSPEGTEGIPRTANAMATSGLGALVAAGRTPSEAPSSIDRLRPGDLVFFALRSQTHVSHSGIYVGQDEKGRMRFMSSRPGPDGPTMGDSQTRGTLEVGTFRERLRRVIRL